MNLKIALLTYSTKPRGSVVHTLELADALYQLGHNPCVFALDKDGSGFHRSTRFSTCALPAQPCYGNTDQLIEQRVSEFVQFFQDYALTYDIYHAQDCLSANALAILKDQGRISHFVRTVHHIESFRSVYLQACQEKSLYQPDRCLCVSQLWQDVLKADYGIDAFRVSNGVSDRFSPILDGSEADLARSLGLGSGPIYLTVGGIEPRKNSINLLRAFAKVRQNQPQAQLIIAGGATLFDYQDYRTQFMAIADTLDLGDGLLLPGVVADEAMPALYRLASGFVFPSIKEGWGLVVMEAIASGLPVVTSHQAPFTEFLTAANAWLVDPYNTEAIASAMLEMTAQETALEIAAPPKTTPLLPTWLASARQHLNLYHQLIS